MTYKLGSLFSGSGGFELAGILCGIEPVLASEVEPYPIAVTRSRIPSMKHLGDVSKINGAEIEPVDVLTFGSPCQDMSVAGKRAGLKHEDNGDDETTRSGLFMEPIRIIKEMREATNGRYPAFAVWENVPGAFSSNKGEDFRCVLQSLIQIVEPTAVVPEVPKNGWPYADYYCGDGWSLAYRVLDAQYWGVPQRRRRIYLVLDLRGERAGKILFERESLRGYSASCGAAWEGTPADAQAGIGADDREGACGVKVYESHPMDSRIKELVDDISPTVSVKWHKGAADTPLVCEKYLFENHSQDTRYKGPLDVCPMLPAQLGTGGNNQPFVVVEETIPIHDKATRYKGGGPTRNGDGAGNGFGVGKDGDPSPTLSTCDRHIVAYSIGNGQLNQISMSETCNTLDCMHDKQAVLVADKEVGTFQNTGQGWWNESPVGATVRTPCGGDSTLANVCVEAYGVDCRNATEYHEKNGTLQAKANGGFSYNCNQVVCVRYIVRRLTPTECARLQGFPDKWGHPDHKDSLTDEEAEFWREVHLTDCAINGKKPKPKIAEKRTGWESATCDWYNSLHTDSAEYKMWWNGIALPCALYVMQGIEDALKEESEWTS